MCKHGFDYFPDLLGGWHVERLKCWKVAELKSWKVAELVVISRQKNLSPFTFHLTTHRSQLTTHHQIVDTH